MAHLSADSYHPTGYEAAFGIPRRCDTRQGTSEVAIERLRNPKPGGKIAAAREYGIDLTLLMNRLRETPEERSRNLESVMTDVVELRKGLRKAS